MGKKWDGVELQVGKLHTASEHGVERSGMSYKVGQETGLSDMRWGWVCAAQAHDWRVWMLRCAGG